MHEYILNHVGQEFQSSSISSMHSQRSTNVSPNPFGIYLSHKQWISDGEFIYVETV